MSRDLTIVEVPQYELDEINVKIQELEAKLRSARGIILLANDLDSGMAMVKAEQWLKENSEEK